MGKINLSAKAKRKNEKFGNRNKSFKNNANALVTYSKPKPSKKKQLKKTKKVDSAISKKEKDFIEHVKKLNSSDEFKTLAKHLAGLGLSVEDFLDAIDLKKFLSTNYNPKGAIFEVFIFNDKKMFLLLKERADGSFLSLYVDKNKINQGMIGNIENKQLDIKKFENLETFQATNFKTIPDEKLYLDFSMVRYDANTKNLFLVLPGEIKEPRAASELREQFGRFLRRLENTKEIEFTLGKKKVTVASKDVFYVKDNFVGVARRPNELRDPTRGKNVSEKTNIMEIVNLNRKETKPESGFSKQEFIRFLVKINPQLNPDRIQKALIRIKTEHLKLKHK